MVSPSCSLQAGTTPSDPASTNWWMMAVPRVEKLNRPTSGLLNSANQLDERNIRGPTMVACDCKKRDPQHNKKEAVKRAHQLRGRAVEIDDVAVGGPCSLVPMGGSK